MIVREVENPKLKDLACLKGAGLDNFKKLAPDIKVVGSGKGALALVLSHLKEKGILTSKLDEILVPDWLGYWVYNQIQPYAFPVKKISERTKAILVYHQYGFPQDMEKIMAFARENNLVVIEDCAHALSSSYQDKQVGEFGDYTIYSFSKWFFCFALGGVSAKDENFYDYLKSYKSSKIAGVIKNLFKLLDEFILSLKGKLFKQQTNLLLKMSYALYGDAIKPGYISRCLLENKIEKELEIREERYKKFIEQVSALGVVDHLEKDSIAPYVIPIICPEEKNQILVDELKEIGINTGVYNFDINRNMLNPNYKKCVWIPVAGQIEDDLFNQIIKKIEWVIKESN